MIPELGNYFLILAMISAILLGVLPLIGAHRQHDGLMNFAPKAANSLFFLLLASYACLTYSFVVNDFSVAYVANHSYSQLPLHYRFTAVWGSHEGSLLLWILILGGWTFAVSCLGKNLNKAMYTRVLAIMGLISVGFISFALFTSNPFERELPFIPIDGADLNPLLQDFGFLVHPPMLYMGFVGFSVAFAFAIAGLLGGELDHKWARWTRPWTTAAWVFLTLGIGLGSWWAYYELGWGGWWFWDPVENASFMPWLAGTALIHSLAATEKRGVLKSWTVLLAILTFSLSLLGTFLVRSGSLTSVHAFANDPVRGRYILIFMGIAIVGALLVYAVQSPKIRSKVNFGLYSRETALLLNNALLAVLTFIVLLGTLHPLVMEAFTDTKPSVGPPYFNLMFSIFTVPMFLLMPIGQEIQWKQQDIKVVLKKYAFAFVACLVISGAVMASIVGLSTDERIAFEPKALLGLSLGLWIVAGLVRYIQLRMMSKTTTATAKSSPELKRLSKVSRSYWGMIIAHLGVASLVLGITITSFYSIEKNIRIERNQTVSVTGYDIRFDNFENINGPNYIASRATFSIFKDGDLVEVLLPEKRRYNASQMVMTEAAIDSGFAADLYIALGEPLENGAWAIRVYDKPLMRWIWLGAILMALGGIVAMSDKRYRQRKSSK